MRAENHDEAIAKAIIPGINWLTGFYSTEIEEKMSYNDKAIELHTKMDRAICDYIVFCTGVDMSSIDYSAINESIDDSVTMLGGTPANEV